MTNFSFIIPHKNLPFELLQKCIDSIPKREDVEVIIIDDNSDHTVVDKEKLASLHDEHTRVIFDDSSKGPGHSRNLGIETAKGKWLLFADADDYYDAELLENFMHKLQDCDAEVVYLGVKIVNLDGSESEDCYGYQSNSNELQTVEDKSKFLVDQHQSWRRALKAEFVRTNKLEYPDIRYCEDQSFTVKAIVLASKMALYPHPVYCYIHRSSSITKQLALKDLKDALHDSFVTNNFLKQNNRKEHLVVPAYILSLIRKNNIFLFYYYAMKNFICVGGRAAKEDYIKACAMSYIATNPVKVFVDWARVSVGAMKQKLKR